MGIQVTGYYAPTARHGTPDDFRRFVDVMHRNDIGVLLDWVPAHFPRDGWALARFDGTPLYEHGDPRRGEHPDWGTYVFNYGRNQVRNFLVANAHYWAEEFHIDGLRVDAVASMLYLDYSRQPGAWVPNINGGKENLEAIALLREVNDTLHARKAGVITVAEESTTWPGVTRSTASGGLGFDFKWNMGWMHDTLDYLHKDPVYRRYAHHQMTFGLMYAWSERFILPLSHDEVVHLKGSLLGKMSGDPWQRFANLRAMFGWMWAHPGKKLLFMGGELGDEHEWAHESASTGRCSMTPRMPVSSISSPTSGLCTRVFPRSGSSTRAPAASSGSTPATPTRTSSASSAAMPTDTRGSPASPTSHRSSATTSGWTPVARPVVGGAQHRFSALRRQWCGQSRRGRGRAGARALLLELGATDPAPARRGLAGSLTHCLTGTE